MCICVCSAVGHVSRDFVVGKMYFVCISRRVLLPDMLIWLPVCDMLRWVLKTRLMWSARRGLVLCNRVSCVGRRAVFISQHCGVPTRLNLPSLSCPAYHRRFRPAFRVIFREISKPCTMVLDFDVFFCLPTFFYFLQCVLM